MNSEARAELAGVRGWLLVFCIFLTLVYPMMLFLAWGPTFRFAEALEADYPRIMTVVMVIGALSLGMVILSIYSGVRLWRARPKALAWGKRALLAIWAYMVISGLLPFTAGFPNDLNLLMAREFSRSLLITSAYCFLWWMYLKRSKRVAATFGLVHKDEQ